LAVTGTRGRRCRLKAMTDVAIRAAARPGQRRLVYRCAVLAASRPGPVIRVAARVPGRPGSKTERITWRDGETGGVVKNLPADSGRLMALSVVWAGERRSVFCALEGCGRLGAGGGWSLAAT